MHNSDHRRDNCNAHRGAKRATLSHHPSLIGTVTQLVVAHGVFASWLIQCVTTECNLFVKIWQDTNDRRCLTFNTLGEPGTTMTVLWTSTCSVFSLKIESLACLPPQTFSPKAKSIAHVPPEITAVGSTPMYMWGNVSACQHP